MKFPSFICLSIVGLIMGLDLPGQAACSLQNTHFAVGEKIRYQVYYNIGFIWIPAGICDFETGMRPWTAQTPVNLTKKTKENSSLAAVSRPALHLKATGVTHRAYDPFFMVRDTLESYVNPHNLIPYESIKYTHEGKWHGQDNFLFLASDTSSGWNICTQLKRRTVWKDPRYSHSKDCGFDIISSIYRMRNLPDSLLLSGQAIHIPLRLDDAQYDVWLKYQGNALIKLHKGDKHYAHYFELSLIEGSVFKKGDVLKLWLSQDANRIPLLIESPIRVGSVKAVFEQAENLLYPQKNFD